MNYEEIMTAVNDNNEEAKRAVYKEYATGVARVTRESVKFMNMNLKDNNLKAYYTEAGNIEHNLNLLAKHRDDGLQAINNWNNKLEVK